MSGRLAERTAAAPPAGRRRGYALAVCLVAVFMTLLDVSIVNVALPSIRTGLGGAPSGLQWILSGYSLAFGLLLVPAGRIGDARSRRATFAAGVVLFTAASLAAGFAPGIGVLIAARLAQGAAGGIVTPQVAGLIQQLYRGDERGRAFGLLGGAIGVATAAGPLLGGAIIQVAGAAEGWRWVFFVNVPIGVAVVPLALRLLPHRSEVATGRRQSLDPVGVAILGAGVTALLLPLVQAQEWPGPLKWLLVPAAVAVLAGFVRWERRYRRRGGDPVVDLTLFRRRSYAWGCALALAYFAGFTGIFFTLTLFLQNHLHESALEAGATITPFAVGSAIAAPIAGRLVARTGRRLVIAGLLLVTAGLAGVYAATTFAPEPYASAAMALPLLVAGLGGGAVVSPNQTVTLSEVPRDEGGSAAGVLQTGQRIGTAAGIAAVGAVFFATLGGTGDYPAAFHHGLLVLLGLILLAVLPAVAGSTGPVVRGRAVPRRAGCGTTGSQARWRW